MNESRKHTILLIGVIALSAVLNLWNNEFGVPHVFGRNVEARIVTIAVNAFVTGDMNPHTAIYPHLQLYVLLAAFLPFYLWGRLTGALTSRADFLTVLQNDPSPLYVISRSVTALFGTGCVIMVYLISRRVFGTTVALIAALFTACAPLLVTNSHLVTPDVMMTFFILATLYFAIRIREDRRRIDYILSGAMLGFGFTVKYPAAVAAVFILSAHILRRGKDDVPSDPVWQRYPSILSIGFGIITILLALTLDLRPIASPIQRNFAVSGETVRIIIRGLMVLFGSILIVLPYLCRKIRVFGQFLHRHRYFILSVISCALFIFIGSPYLLFDFSLTMNSLLYHALTESEPFWGTEETPVGWFYYLILLRDGTSLPFMPVFLIGTLALLFRRRRNDLLLLSFPLIYYAFMGSFETKFPRYILPLVPCIAIFAASLVDTLTGGDAKAGTNRARKALVITLALIAVPSLESSIQWDLKMGRIDTRTIAKEWIERTIPPGSRIAIEALGPPLDESNYRLYVHHQGKIREISELDPWAHYRLGEIGEVQHLIDAGIEYIVVNSNTYGNYYRVPHLYPNGYEFYVQLDSLFTRLETFQPDNGPGPEIRVYSLEP
jgi:hypothetical protein